MKQNFIFAVIILTIILSSCYPDPPPIPILVATPQVTATSTPTITPTPSPTPVPWQTYKFTYTIHRDNHGKLWLPVPKEWDEIGMRNVEILSFSREPSDLFEDSQGNLIAYWSAKNRGTLDYSITYQLQVSPIDFDIDPNSIEILDNLSEDLSRYLQPSKWIQSSEQEIISLAKEIIGNEKNPYEQARLIHSWVSRNIASGDVSDAITTLENRKAGCGGHSWLFIAMLRALGIPARGIGGLTPNNEVYFESGSARKGTMRIHIWSEFYIEGIGWIQCDTSGGSQNFAKIHEPRIILFRGEDIKLGYGYPLDTIPWFHSPNEASITDSTPQTQTWGYDLTLDVEIIE